VNESMAVQVCFDITDSETPHRELEGLKEACSYFNLKEGYVITYDQSSKMSYKNLTVHIVPAYRFILH